MKKQIQQKITDSSLLKGLIILGSGTAISQVLGIIFVPILTRIYPPEIYGTLAVFTSLLTILTVGSSLKYEFSFLLAEKDEDAEYLLILCFLIVGILTIILLVILIVFGDFLATIFNFEFMKPYYLLFCIGFLGISVYQILTYWAIRSKNYTTITQTRVTQSIIGSLSKIILGILSFGSLGLICGDIIGRIVGIGTLGKTILPKIWRSIHNLDYNKMRSLANRYRKFPTFSFPSGFINEIALRGPTLFLSIIFGFQIVGLFSLSYTILVLPVSIVSSSMAQVYYGESSELLRQKSDKILTFYQETTRKLFLFGAPLIFIGAIISPLVFPIIFGSDWKDAGMFALPLSIMVVAQFVVSSTDRLELYGYNQWELYWNIWRTIMVIAGFYLAYLLHFSPLVTVFLYSVIMTVMYGVCYILNITAIKQILQTKDDPITH